MTPSDFAQVAKLLQSRSAIALEPGKEYLVDSRLLPVAKRHGLASVAEFIAKLREPGANGYVDDMVEAMVTTETSFFRDVHPFERFRKTILPEILAARREERKLAIWCGAASSGQEPYTLAILIKEWFPELATWDVSLQATDISKTMLDRCREGLFSQIEVNRGLPAALLVKYFTQEGNRWRIDPRLRAMIDFRPLNLAGPWPQRPPFDLVFLRNVMIYFDMDTKREILRKIARILRPDGYLVLGGAESTLNLSDAFQRVDVPKCGYYRLAREGGVTVDRLDLVEAGVAAVQTAFEELCQTPVAPGGPLEFGPDAVAATIALKRNPPGLLTLVFPPAVLETLAGRYLPAESLTSEMLSDVAGEFANVVAGQIKTMLKGTPDHFDLSTPQVRPFVKSDPAAMHLPFECDAGGFTLELLLPPT